MCDRFIKFIPSDEAMWLLKKKGNAFRLLAIIAESARRYEGGPDGLKVGECFIGGHENYDMTEQNYRTAKKILVKRQHLEIIETCRNRKKSTTGSTTVGTKVKLLSSSIWDINLNDGNDRVNDCLTTDQRPTNDKQEREEDKERKEDHPSVPSKNPKAEKRNDRLKTDDFSFEMEKKEIIPGVFLSPQDLEACLHIKGDMEKVRQAMEHIQNSPKRKHPIADWPNTLMKWKVETKRKVLIEDHIAYTKRICQEFQEFDMGRGWRCCMYKDTKKDQRGILFECQSPYQESLFLALIDAELKEKCEDFIKNKKMRKRQEPVSAV